MVGTRSQTGGVGLKLLVGSLVTGLLIAVGLLLLRCTASGVWNTLVSDQGIADLITAIVGSIIGAGLAVLVAYSILRAQILADRDLASESHTADVVHEVAGELAVWVSGMTDPFGSGRAKRLPSDGPSHVIRALTSRKDLLHRQGVESMDGLLTAVRQLEADRASLVDYEKSIRERVKKPSTSVAVWAQFSWDLISELGDEWKKVVLEMSRISDQSRALVTWRSGDKLEPYEFPKGSRISNTIQTEKRLTAKGHEIVRDKCLDMFGAYDDLESKRPTKLDGKPPAD